MPVIPAGQKAHVVGAAPLWVLGTVAGPRRRARLLHTGRDAAYLDVDGTCLAVLSARAVRVPCGVRTELPALPPMRAGDAAAVEDGALEVPGLEVLVTDIVDTTVPVVGPDAVARAGRALAEALGGRLRPVVDELPGEALALLARADRDAVDRLLGLGGGLTPLGDDVLSGWLATGVATRHPALPEMRSTVALSARARTTTLSATLLACAARGEGVPEFRELLAALSRDDGHAVADARDRLLAIGDTSGAGLLLGALLALRSLGPSVPATGPAADPATDPAADPTADPAAPEGATG